MSREVKILRSIITSQICPIVLAEALPDWAFRQDQSAIARLSTVILQLSKEFDSGVVKYAAFDIPGSARPNVVGDDSNTLFLALMTKDNVVVSTFYTVLTGRREQTHQDFIDRVNQQILDQFLLIHGEHYASLRQLMEDILKERTTMPEEEAAIFASFGNQLSGIIATVEGA